MDIPYMGTSSGFSNDTDFINSDFIENNLGLALPYLIIITLCTIIGCIGNAMVIGCVGVYKVGVPYLDTNIMFHILVHANNRCKTGVTSS